MLNREALIWKRLIHPNIVPFTGVTLDPLQIVSEWMSGGDLPIYIKSHPDANRVTLVSPLFGSLQKPATLAFRQLIGIATGVKYLHQCDVIHGDLKGVSAPSSPGSGLFTHAYSQTSWWMPAAVHG